MKLQFSGHESFICKHFWLKKGYDFILNNGNFNADNAVVELGVGKNMVTSISYWLKAFGITDANNHITDLGRVLLDDENGVDPYFENIGTIWLLHYALIKTKKASLYNLFFNEFRKGRNEFTKEGLIHFISRKVANEERGNINANTLAADISVFLRNYLKPDTRAGKADWEDEFSNLLVDLSLFKPYQSENAEGKLVDWYQIESGIQTDLPFEIVLFTILDNEDFGKAIPFKDLLTSIDSPGTIFLLNEEGLYNKLVQIEQAYKSITYTETAGVKQLQIKSELNKWEVLRAYYQK